MQSQVTDNPVAIRGKKPINLKDHPELWFVKYPLDLLAEHLPDTHVVTMLWLIKLANRETGLVQFCSAQTLTSVSNSHHANTFNIVLRELEAMGHITRQMGGAGNHENYPIDRKSVV